MPENTNKVVYAFSVYDEPPVCVLGPPGLDMSALQQDFRKRHEPTAHYTEFRRHFILQLCAFHGCEAIDSEACGWLI